MKIGIIREGKIPVDRRVVLLPEQCKEVENAFPKVEIWIQSSIVRCIKDEEYENLQLPVQENMDDCDVLIGVKEVSLPDLIPDKTYLFFSHTIKKQPQNQKLLQTVLQRNIRLIDYECLTDDKGDRIIAFGHYAGIVGVYNAFWILGNKYGGFHLHRAIDCKDYEDLLRELKKVRLPKNYKIALTGRGRAGGGGIEILKALNIKQVTPQQYLNEDFDEPVWVHLASSDYYHSDTTQNFSNFYEFPEQFKAHFLPFALQTDMLIPTHFWHTKAAPLFSKADMQRPDFRIKIVADITCDINGSIPCTIRSSTIPSPIYDYNPHTEQEERPLSNPLNITVMAVDNLPCELPFGASKSFGEQFINKVLPHFFNEDKEKVLQKATIAQNGKLMPAFEYLSDYIEIN
jgi:saccharopine dehydrogenase (NAD+, L-lysine forming)